MEKTFFHQYVRIGVCAVLLGVGGCGEDPQQLFETAQFEEQQNNRVHARELYERIIAGNPDSEYAKMAKERLDELSDAVEKSRKR